MSRPAFVPEVGMYARHYMGAGSHSTLVRISDSASEGRFWVEYIDVSPTGAVRGGGHSGSWPPHEFHPLTDAKDILAAQVFEAQRTREAARELIATSEREIEVGQAALVALAKAEGRLAALVASLTTEPQS